MPRDISMCASASMVAAPPMSFFMLSMPASDLMSSPPVSKQTPLPISVTFGCEGIAPGDVDQAGRAVGGGGAADRMDEREVLLEQILADDHVARWRRAAVASARAAYSSSGGPMSFAGVLIRSRARKTPSTMRVRSSPSTPSGSSSWTSLPSALR